MFIATVCEAGNGSGAITDGNSLSEGLRLFYKGADRGELTRGESESAFAAISYLGGFLGGCGIWQVESQHNAPFQLPKEGLGTMQFAKIVNKYLQDHPDRLHIKAEFLLYLALRDSFPNGKYTEPTEPSPSE
jgi:hypothetical protein